MPSDLRFTEVKKLLEDHGWSFNRITGSHHVFTGPARRPISIPVHHGKVKYVYKRKIEKAIEEFRRGKP